jgi:hypothetical protein
MKVVNRIWKQAVIVIAALVVGIVGGYIIGHNEIRVEDYPQFIAISDDNFSSFTLPAVLPDNNSRDTFDFTGGNKIGDLK